MTSIPNIGCTYIEFDNKDTCITYSKPVDSDLKINRSYLRGLGGHGHF